MKTDELVSMLAQGAGPVPRHAVEQRIALALLPGLALTVVLMAVVLGPRADLAEATREGMFWLKVAFTGALSVAAWLAGERLARPGMRLGGVRAGIAAPVLVIWLLAVLALGAAAPEARPGLLLGSTWRVCPLNIAMLSLPMFCASLWAMKGLAPTRPALAGAATGLLSGALGALVYTLHCPESAAPFLAIWYVLGIFIPAGAGALIGWRLLRW